jgi:hypothetical protein
VIRTNKLGAGRGRLLRGHISNDWQPYELDALWLLTREGEFWDCKLGGERESYPVFQGDVVDYIRDEILGRANDWSNERVRRYLARRHEVD